MESLGKIALKSKNLSAYSTALADDSLSKKKSGIKKNPHLHSPAHLLADELCLKLNDKKHFAFYLKMAVLYDHNYLRGLAGQILENKNVTTPGKLFAYLIKKNNLEKKQN
jgi:hypothetical protein